MEIKNDISKSGQNTWDSNRAGGIANQLHHSPTCFVLTMFVGLFEIKLYSADNLQIRHILLMKTQHESKTT